jgi:hypothetical protein
MPRTNVGPPDRIVRIVLGVGLVFTGPFSAWGWLGFVPLMTGLTGACPIYHMLGIRAREAE